jgi:hypothetical protein
MKLYIEVHSSNIPSSTARMAAYSEQLLMVIQKRGRIQVTAVQAGALVGLPGGPEAGGPSKAGRPASSGHRGGSPFHSPRSSD